MTPNVDDSATTARHCAGAMQGFSDEFVSPEHYIIDITYRIWEGGRLDLINEWYHPTGPVRTPHGVTSSAQAVIDGSARVLEEFPDRELFAEDVIIGAKADGFLSSHRVRSTATHLGNGLYGRATRRPVTMLTIADCWCEDNQVIEEWLVRDTAATAQQLGIDPAEMGRGLGAGDPSAYAIGNDEYRRRWESRHGFEIEGDAAVATTVLSSLDALWSVRSDRAMIPGYDRALRRESSGVVTYGWPRALAAVRRVTDVVADGVFEAHHVVVENRADRPIRVAVRWSYLGTHSGRGAYGEPTGVPLAVLAITHFELRDEKILNEWTVFDDVAIWAQIEAYARS